MHNQFVFGDFILQSDGILLYNNKQISIPPKELAVLTTLLEAAGELVTKDDLLTQVWGNAIVGEESLTRCIYSLRCILFENKEKRYIDTVYGKGYRFSFPVITIAAPQQITEMCLLAILPFKSQNKFDSLTLHALFIQGLSRYSSIGLSVLPVAVTQNCQNPSDIIAIISQFTPNYYISGQVMQQSNSWILHVELVCAHTHQLLHHDNIVITFDDSLRPLQIKLTHFLLQNIPSLNWSKKIQNHEISSLDTAITYINALQALHRCTPSSLLQALTLLRHCTSSSPKNARPYCSLAECYLSLSQLGLFNPKLALKLAQEAIHHAVTLDAGNPLVTGLLGLISSIRGEKSVAHSLFASATCLAPKSSNISFYYALHLLLSGDPSHALIMLDGCLENSPFHTNANILKLWLTFCMKNLNEAIALGKRLLEQYAQHQPIIQSLLALFLAMQKKQTEADNLVLQIKDAGEDLGWLTVNHYYIYYCKLGQAAIPELQTFLEKYDSRLEPASLLPLIQITKGDAIALRHWWQIEKRSNSWIKTWGLDPRLKTLINKDRTVKFLPSAVA